MAFIPSKSTREGYQWTEISGLQTGIPCVGVVEPETNVSQSSPKSYDVIVIGAGYAGLTATRDLTTTGHNVLLLEARDRIGGRTWSADVNSYPFEMGGTWVHWNQPFMYREMTRYGIRKDLAVSPVTTGGVNCFTLTGPSGKQTLTHQDAVCVIQYSYKFIF